MIDHLLMDACDLAINGGANIQMLRQLQHIKPVARGPLLPPVMSTPNSQTYYTVHGVSLKVSTVHMILGMESGPDPTRITRDPISDD